MKRVLLTMALTVLTMVVRGTTVTNTYALVAGWGNSGVNLYKVGADSTKWTYVRGIRSGGDGRTTFVSDAVRVGDVVYVLDMIDETAASERFIRKYALDGSGYLDDLASLGTDREAGCLCVSSDGLSLYVGYTFRTAAGCVDRVSLADGTVTQNFATGLGAIRQLATDGKGHLFAANREGKLSVIRETDGAVLTTVAGDVSGSQGVAYDPVNDCCWWSKMSTSNYGTFTFAEPATATVGLSRTDGAWGAHCFAVATLDGLPFFGSFSDKKIYRRAADGTIVAVTDAAGTAITYPAQICGLIFFREEIEVSDVARVYVTVPSVGVRTYLVNSLDEWRLEGTFAAKVTDKMDCPVAFEKAGDFFYACDQHQDAQLGYFSISRYDTAGAYRGRLVYKNTLNASKADNMTVSPDGKYLYVSCFNGGAVLRVTVADGSVASFATANVGNSRGACVSSDGTVFVANRSKSEATAYDPTTGAVTASYARTGASGVFCDDEDDLVYVSDNGANGATTIYTRSGSSTGTLTGTGNCMAIAKVNGRIVFGNWGGQILSYAPGSGVTALSPILSGLGNIQHLYVEPLGADTRVQPTAASVSFAAPASGDWLVVRDEGLGIASAAEKTTIWKSSDKGATWSVQGELSGVRRPAVYTLEGRTFLVGEKVRAAEEDPLEIVGYERGSDGQWTSYVSVPSTGMSRVPGPAMHLCGTVALPTVFGGVRPFFPMVSAKARTFDAFSLLYPSHDSAPDPCFAAENLTLSNYFANANAEWRDKKNPLDALGDGTAVSRPTGGVALLFPNVPRRTTTADRLAQEGVLVATNWFASSTPTVAGWAKLPGGAKPFAAFWDETSACYWAVTTPETNLTRIVISDPNQTRNVLALYASENLFDWRPAGLIRAEGTPETVAFDRPCAAADGDDLVLVYKTAGSVSAAGVTPIAADGRLVFQRVANFRARKPSFAKDPEILLSLNYTYQQVDRYVKDPTTGDWHADGAFAVGKQLGKDFQNLVGIASACGRVYAAAETVGVFEFSTKGRCLRFFGKPAGHNVDALAISSDGATLWATDCTKATSAVMKLDLRTGAWTILVEGTGTADFLSARALAVKRDGSFFVGLRDVGSTVNLRYYAADGSTYEELNVNFTDLVSLALNETEDVLYCGSRLGRVIKVELTNGLAQTELTSPGLSRDNGAFAILPKGDKLYCVDGTAAVHYRLDANAANQIPEPLFGGGLFLGRSAFVDTAFRRGLTILVR